MTEPAPRPAALATLGDRREQVIALLTDRFSVDALDLDAFDRRVDLAHRAASVADLDALVADLEPPRPAALASPPAALAVRAGAAARPAFKKVWCVMGGLGRRGRWVVPRAMHVRCVMGGARLDFREADFGPGVTELHVIAVMGGLEIVVPPELAVEVEASAFFGGFDEGCRAPAPPEPGRAVLRITGLVVMGGVEIRTRRPGEGQGAAVDFAEAPLLSAARAARAARALPPRRD